MFGSRPTGSLVRRARFCFFVTELMWNIGLLAVDPGSAFLVAITGREQVAVVKGSPIYVVTDVALIPLASKAEAEAAVGKAAKKKREGPLVGSDTEEGETDVEEEVGEVAEELPAGRRTESTSSIGEDVIGRKGAYGRFAERWVSKRGWTADRRRSEGMSSADLEDGEGLSLGEKPENQPAPIDEDQTPKDAEVEEEAEAVRNTVTHSLTPKLLYTTRLLLAQSRSFYFSYDWDITRSWGAQVGEGSSSLPLWKRVDSEVSLPGVSEVTGADLDSTFGTGTCNRRSSTLE